MSHNFEVLKIFYFITLFVQFISLSFASTWSFQSILTELVIDYNSTSPVLITGQVEKTLFSGYNGLSIGVHVYTNDFLNNQNIWTQQAKLLPSDYLSRSGYKLQREFGYDMKILSNSIFISSPLSSSGAVYIFNGSRNSWTQYGILTAHDTKSGSYFGVSVDAYNETAVVGASQVDGKGAVYIFNSSYRDTTITSINPFSIWSQQQKLIASDGKSKDLFGEYVSLFNKTVFISARQADSNGVDAGAVYVFQSNANNTWSQQQRLFPRDSDTNREFGYSPVIQGYVAAIGAFSQGGTTSDSVGSAYIFTTTGTGNLTWSQQAKLTFSSSLCHYGTSLALYNRTLVAASLFNKCNGSSNSVYVFTRGSSRNVWSHTQTLIAATPGAFFTKLSLYQSNLILRNFSTALYYSSFSSTGCLRLLLGDHFNDGWDTARLRAQLPDGSYTDFSPHLDTTYPMSLRYCPNMPADEGEYYFRIRAFNTTKFVWEISYQIQVESTGVWYHGDHATRMTFYYDAITQSFSFLRSENLIQPSLACKTCTLIEVKNWLEIQATGSDSWIQLFVTNTSFFISDPHGRSLYSAGTVCNNVDTYMCIQTLKDGNYIMKIGNGYGSLARPGNTHKSIYESQSNYYSSWRFCGRHGSTMQYFYFNLTNGGFCSAGTIF